MSEDRKNPGDAQDDAIALARAFASAHYLADLGGEPIRFGVGQPVPDIEDRLPADTYAFITAWNPDAERQPVVENAESDDALASKLETLGANYRRVWAQDAQGSHREAGWLIAGLGSQRTDELGREFDQAGILGWSRGEPVRLRMLMPAPPDAAGAGLPHVDWIE